MERFHEQPVLVTGMTRAMLFLLAAVCSSLVAFGIYCWSLGFVPGACALGLGSVCSSVFFFRSRYQLSKSTVLFRTLYGIHWVELVKDIVRVAPAVSKGPFGHCVHGLMLEFESRDRFVAPQDPDSFLEQLKQRRPDLRAWGGELRSPVEKAFMRELRGGLP